MIKRLWWTVSVSEGLIMNCHIHAIEEEEDDEDKIIVLFLGSMSLFFIIYSLFNFIIC